MEVQGSVKADVHESESVSCSTMSDSLQPSASVLCPWNSPGNNTGVGRRSLLHGFFQTQRSNRSLLHCRRLLSDFYHQGSPKTDVGNSKTSSLTQLRTLVANLAICRQDIK